jgi:hypothetical protein
MMRDVIGSHSFAGAHTAVTKRVIPAPHLKPPVLLTMPSGSALEHGPPVKA